MARFDWRAIARSRGIQLSVAVVIAAGLLSYELAGDGRVDRLSERLGPVGPPLLVVSQALIAVSPFPSQIVAVPIGVIYGFAWGVGLIWCGWMLAALLQYGLSRRTADDIDLDSWIARTPAWLQRFPADHPAFLILARQLPIGPHIVNITAGVMHVPLRRHLWCAAIGIVPESLLISGLASSFFR